MKQTRTKTGYSFVEANENETIHLSIKDLLITICIMVIVTGIGCIFLGFGFTESNIITIYILGVLLTSLFTKSHLCSGISSLASVLLFNFFFTEPRLTFHAYEHGYPVTFVIMLTAAFITGTLANQLKNHAKQSAQSAFRTQILLDTNQMLQKAEDENRIINITASQLLKLLERDIIIWSEKDEKLENAFLFCKNSNEEENCKIFAKEQNIAEWVFKNQSKAGTSTSNFSKSKNQYLAICINQKVYGVIGIHIEDKNLDAFEQSVLLSIVGECALAIENIRNAKEKEEVALLAEKEQLRANLLRTISHDLRTPLTSISGNASNLMSDNGQLDDQTRQQMYTDIYDDSQWLISLVENLLSITRIEEGRLNFNKTMELMEEVIEEALRHIHRKHIEHAISVTFEDELLLVKMDAKLILQVIINLVDNAIKYTPPGSDISISTGRKNKEIFVRISDNGAGIPDKLKEKAFEMFYTGNNKIADSRRSLGLGLSLCKSIINVHGGELTLEDNKPHGCIFTFTLPIDEVKTDE